ncbi:MAG TPA: hypothetical protein PKK30_18190, partial [Nitrospira sp.]|nr:hypothetical protein [Nitrospira sp.]
RSLQQGTNDWPALSPAFPNRETPARPYCLSHCMTGVGPGRARITTFRRHHRKTPVDVAVHPP